MLVRSLLALVLLGLTCGPAQAGSLILHYQGLTVGSTLDGNPITNRTLFDVYATFDDMADVLAVGQATYVVTDISVIVGGTSYSTAFTPGDFAAFILDPTNTSFGGVYFPALVSSTSGAFAHA